MSILTAKDPTYTITDLGFDKSLVKVDQNESLMDSVLPELRNVFTEGITPKSLTSGELLSDFEQKGILQSGKTTFTVTDTGYILGIDETDSLAKFYLGNSVDYLYWDGTNLVLTGGTVIGSVGGFVITPTALSNGDLILNSGNQAIEAGSGNNIAILDADNATYRLWIGHATAASASFSVTKGGSVNIDAGTIDGVTIGGSSAGAITGTSITATSFVIGANTLTTSEWAFLDGIDQALKQADSPTFNQGNFTTIHGTTLLIDHVGEHTGTHGVVFDNDITRVGKLSIDHLAEATGAHGIVFDNDISRVGKLSIDHIAEATGAHGVVFDNNIDINGGAIDGTPIGASSASSGVFNSLTDSTLTALQMVQGGTGGVLQSVVASFRLSETTGINAKNVATTTLYTVPAGKTAIITHAVIRVTAADTITVVPTLGIGVAAGEDDIYPSTVLTGLDATTKVFTFSAEGTYVNVAPAGVIKLGVDVGATATTMTITIDLFGYLI